MSTPQGRERSIFEAALALPPKERAGYLEQACGGDPQLRQCVEALLLDHGQAGHPVAESGPPPPGPTVQISVPLTEKAGDKIGHYKLLQEIGEGGCGVVYMAEQEEPIRRRVALKVIKLGMDTKQVIARFEAERQALALMDHPNIAKVLDAGATETGRPYFVMELVRGIKITDYCDQNNLSTEARLELFMQVCHAIQHAHQKGIIHRDIKPSNTLVTLHDGKPVPKVIDFGIAKATQQRLTDKTLFTAFEQFIGTPAYMSPEQAEMSGLDIDTRSDIYSLGVLLYELLTGKTPFDAKELIQAGLDEMRRIIREQEPARPSTKISTLGAEEQTTIAKRRQLAVPKLIHLVRGDLDWIVMKCLEKDRTRRYETASALALELKRYLSSEPVVARPPSHSYLLKKLVKRNRLAFAAAGAILASVIVGLCSATVMFYKERTAKGQADSARQAESEMRQKAQAAEATNRTLAEVRRLNGQALLLATFAPTLGDPRTPAAITALARAEYATQTAKDLALKLGPDHPEQGALNGVCALLESLRGRPDKAEALAREALRVLPKGHPDAMLANIILSAALKAQGRDIDADRVIRGGLPATARTAIQQMERAEDAERARELERISHITCTNNLKMISLAFSGWANDHDAFPYNVPQAKGGTLELSRVDGGGYEQNPVPHFRVLSNALSSTRYLVCWDDDMKVSATSFQELTAANITYQLRSGPALDPHSTNEVLARCPIHCYQVYCGTTEVRRDKGR